MAQPYPLNMTKNSGSFSFLTESANIKKGYYLEKRSLDILLSSVLLILLSPAMLLIGILIRLDSSGPAIYSQKRVGCKYHWWKRGCRKEARLFTFYKFRTMFQGADQQVHRDFIHAYIHNDLEEMKNLQHGTCTVENQYKLSGDSRITRIGGFLRKTSLDELPQLWNILKGDMSLVGPRPAIPYEVEMYEPWHLQRLCALPGLTGLWQVTARNSATFDEMVQMDLGYIERQSFLLDLVILIKTPLAVLDRRCN